MCQRSPILSRKGTLTTARTPPKSTTVSAIRPQCAKPSSSFLVLSATKLVALASGVSELDAKAGLLVVATTLLPMPSLPTSLVRAGKPSPQLVRNSSPSVRTVIRNFRLASHHQLPLTVLHQARPMTEAVAQSPLTNSHTVLPLSLRLLPTLTFLLATITSPSTLRKITRNLNPSTSLSGALTLHLTLRLNTTVILITDLKVLKHGVDKWQGRKAATARPWVPVSTRSKFCP